MSLYPRGRITDALQDSANRGLAMLIAPAGFGKSEAARDAFGSAAHWIDSPEIGASVETFARQIIEIAAPRSIRALNPLLSRPSTEENRAHLADWVASRLRSVEQPIVIEDFQRACSDPDSVEFVRRLVESTVPSTRWVIVSRETPELPVGTWLARDYMTLPVSADDLAFDSTEAAAVAQALNVSIDPAPLQELVGDVGGWPLAVRLSLGSWERTRALPPLRIRTRVMLFEYLETEIWSRLTDDERNLFEVAANLSELRPRILSAAGFPDARLALERLHRRLPLLSRVGEGVFRLHELFREFIVTRLKREPERLTALLSKLARALEKFGGIDDAINMYMRVEAYDAVIKILSRHGMDRIESGHRAEIVATLRRFPAAYRNHGVITALRGVSLSLDGALPAACNEMQVALKSDLDDGLRGTVMLQLAAVLTNTGKPAESTAIFRELMVDERIESETRLKAASGLAATAAFNNEGELARDAIGFCTGASDSPSVETRSLVLQRIAFAHYYLGNMTLAESLASESAQLAHSVGLESIAGKCYQILQAIAGSIYSDTLLARRYAEAVVDSAIACGDQSMEITGYQTQLLIAADQGDDDLFERAEARLNEFGGLRVNRSPMLMRLAKVIFEGGRGRIPQAVAALSNVDEASLSPAELALRNAVLALLWTHTDREKANVALSRPMLALADTDQESQRLMLYAHGYHALGQWLFGRSRAARRAGGFDASIAPRDAALMTVVSTICSTQRRAITARQLAQLTEPLLALQLDGHARFLRTVLAPAAINTLTRSELDVLRELRGGGTTMDVADRLGRSSHTVLSHLKSACSKIGCSGRAAAVAYAVDMGWID